MIYACISIHAVVNCGNLTPINGIIFLETTVFGSVANYSCNNSDHQLVGDAVRICQANGTWNGSAPTCGEPVIIDHVLWIL